MENQDQKENSQENQDDQIQENLSSESGQANQFKKSNSFTSDDGDEKQSSVKPKKKKKKKNKELQQVEQTTTINIKPKSPLGELPPLPELKNPRMRGPLQPLGSGNLWDSSKKEEEKLEDLQKLAKQKSQKKVESYSSKMNVIDEAQDPDLEESINNLYQQITKSKLTKVLDMEFFNKDKKDEVSPRKNQKNISEFDKIETHNSEIKLQNTEIKKQNSQIYEQNEIENFKKEINLFENHQINENLSLMEQIQNIKSRMSKQTEKKIKDKLHQIFSYHTILGDGDMHQSIIKPPYIIAIGTQECQRSIAVSVFVSSKDKWEKILQQNLGDKYQMIGSCTMNAMHLAIFVHHDLVMQISNINTNSEATGIANIIGNKGGVGISFNLGKKSYLFINSHLASGQDKTDKRNKDANQVEKKLYKENQIKKNNQLFNYVVWMGDLNYRIGIDRDTVIKMIDEKKFIELLLIDQLLLEKEKGKVLMNFNEGIILFPPTYKLETHQNNFSQGKNKRIPGWTDRILYAGKEEADIEQVNYDSASNMFGSDHRPVYAQFLCKNEPINFQDQPTKIKYEKSKMCNIY